MRADTPDSDSESFSRTYLRPSAASRDSERFRRRLFAWFSENVADGAETEWFSQEARREIGVSMPTTQWASNYEAFFLKAEVRDVLDAISIVHRLLEPRDINRASYDVRA